LIGDGPPGGKALRFVRYDVRVEAPWITEMLDLKVSERDVMRVRSMDDPGALPLAYEIGRRAAERQVQAEHFQPGK